MLPQETKPPVAGSKTRTAEIHVSVWFKITMPSICSGGTSGLALAQAVKIKTYKTAGNVFAFELICTTSKVPGNSSHIAARSKEHEAGIYMFL